MSRAERLAKLKRDLAELRSRALRIHGEADAAVRQVGELAAQLEELSKDGAP